jgi:hypothetical protein
MAAAHHHDGHDMVECVTCHLGGKLATALPAAPPELLAIFLVIAYLVALRPSYVNVVPLRYLIPSRQAPPAHFPL